MSVPMCVCLCPEALQCQFSEQHHQHGSENHSLPSNPAVTAGGKIVSLCTHHEWITLLNRAPAFFSQPQKFPPSPAKALPKFPQQEQPGRQLPQRRGRGANKPKLQAHILEQVLFVFWIKLAFLRWEDSANSVPTLHKKDYIEPQIKDEHIRHCISQFSAHYKLLLHSCKEKKMVYLQSCSQKGSYYYYKNKHKLFGTFSVRIH